jgi:glycerol uptake facilitator-like aquaporin
VVTPLSRRLGVEAFGTFFVVVASILVAIANGQDTYGDSFDWLRSALVNGTILGVMLVACHLSGGLLNPAVTIAKAILDPTELRPQEAAAYIAVQFIAGILGAFLVAFLLPETDWRPIGLGIATSELDPVKSAGIEIVGTALLACAILSTGRAFAGSPAAPGAIGLVAAGVVAVVTVVMIPWYGPRMNPALILAPAAIMADPVSVIHLFIGSLAASLPAGALVRVLNR